MGDLMLYVLYALYVGEIGVTTEGVTESSIFLPEFSRDSISYERVSFLRSSIRASTETNSRLFR